MRAGHLPDRAPSLEGRFALRVAITNHRSRRADFDALVEAVHRIGADVVAGVAA